MSSLPDSVLSEIGKNITTLAATTVKKFANQAVSDGEAFVATTQEQIANWAEQLANDQISQKNFESLVRGEKDLAEMQGLEEAGLAQASIDSFINGVIEIVINAVLGAITL